jgi:hypothetical protein
VTWCTRDSRGPWTQLSERQGLGLPKIPNPGPWLSRPHAGPGVPGQRAMDAAV